MLCERLSGKHVEIGLVPFGSIGLTLFGIDLFFASPAQRTVDAPHCPSAGLLAFARRLARALSISLRSAYSAASSSCRCMLLIQMRSEPDQRARIIAANNILNALFMVVGALAAGAGCSSNGISIPALFGIAALCNAVVAIYIYSAGAGVHAAFRRLAARAHDLSAGAPREWRMCREDGGSCARLQPCQLRRPDRHLGGSAAADPLRDGSTVSIRTPLIGFVFRHMHAIPIAPAKDDAAMMEAAFDEVAKCACRRRSRLHLPRGARLPIPANCTPSAQAVATHRRAHAGAGRCRWLCADCGAASSVARMAAR
jgi:hypothetical protein